MSCEIVFVIFILYYIVEEAEWPDFWITNFSKYDLINLVTLQALEIKRMKWSYLQSLWNILDLVVIGVS